MGTTHDLSFATGTFGKLANVSPLYVVSTLDSWPGSESSPPTITRPQCSELPYPLNALPNPPFNVPDSTHVSFTGEYFQHWLDTG